MKDKNIYGVILAGGIGSRFWPVSTSEYPKQFHDFLGVGRTFIQQTYDRLLSLCPAENIYVITDVRYTDLVKNQLPELEKENIIEESIGMNTAACAIYSAAKIHKKNSEARILICPSDHLILNQNQFNENALLALERAKEKGLFTLGIYPTRPDTGYGYIQFVESEDKVKKVKTFTEKPSLEIAEKFIKSGDFLWNSGIFIWSAEAILKSFKENLPEMYSVFESVKEKLNTLEEKEVIKKIYPTLQKVSVDVGIMEKEREIYVVPSDFGWSDLGTWQSLFMQIEKDCNNNVLLAESVFAYNATGNIVHTEQDKAIIIDGLKDYMVVDTPNALLISPIEKSQEIKTYVTNLKLNKKEKFI